MVRLFPVTGKLLSYFLRGDQVVVHHRNIEGVVYDSEDNEHGSHAHVHSASTFSDTGEDRILFFKRAERKTLKPSDNRASKKLKPLTNYHLSKPLWSLQHGQASIESQPSLEEHISQSRPKLPTELILGVSTFPIM